MARDRAREDAKDAAVVSTIRGAAAQEQQPAPTFRSENNNVQIHERVLDARGEFVTGLTQTDIQIFEDGRGHLIDFPNNTTRICPEMLEKLKKLMGEESWRVDEITFQ